MEIFYASIKNNLIFKKIKYEIGKRYPLVNGIIHFHNWKDVIIENVNIEMSIYLVKVDEINNYFKILKELNYSDFLKSKYKKENLISAMKNRDKWSLSKFSDTSGISKEINICIKNKNYLDELIKLDKLKNLSRFSIKYLHNKYLDYIIDNDDSCYDNDTISHIADIGIPKYLDKILEKEKLYHIFEIRSVLENGRKKDIEKYIDNDQHADAIIKTGIDKYLDKLIINEKGYIDIPCYISQIGRKKDLDILVKSKSEKIRSVVASRGYDEHLDMLVNDESTAVLQSVLDVGRDKDIDILKKSTYAKSLDFSKINNLKR